MDLRIQAIWTQIIYIAAWCAEQALYVSKAFDSADNNDLKLYQTMKDMYFEFTSFANQGYGYESYNKPKEKKLYMSALGKPSGFDINSDDKLRRRPIWAAMAYATADASGEYKWRMQVMKLLKEDALCDPPREDEQRILDSRKRTSRVRIAVLIIICLAIVALLFIFKAHPIISAIIIGIAAIGILDQDVSNRYGTNIWFVGHYYTGPAYWLGGRWR